MAFVTRMKLEERFPTPPWIERNVVVILISCVVVSISFVLELDPIPNTDKFATFLIIALVFAAISALCRSTTPPFGIQLVVVAAFCMWLTTIARSLNTHGNTVFGASHLVTVVWLLTVLVACGIAWRSSLSTATDSVAAKPRRRPKTAVWSLIVLVLLGAGAASFSASRKEGHIDVIVFEHRAGDLLAELSNPYDARVANFPDLYQGQFYDPSLTDTHHLKFGFPYTIVSLLGTGMAQIAFGEPRWAQAAALTAGIALLLVIGRRRTQSAFGPFAVLLLISTPATWYVLRAGYIEPILFMLFALSVYAAIARPQLLPYVLAIFFASKQYVPLLLPLLVLLVPWSQLKRRAFALPFIATFATITVPPLALTGYWHSVMVVQLLQPFRIDSVSLAAAWTNHGHAEPGTLVPFLPPLVALALCLRFGRRTPAGFVTSCGFVLLAFFSFSKQSFANYHFLVIAVFCTAIAVHDVESASAGEKPQLHDAVPATSIQ